MLIWQKQVQYWLIHTGWLLWCWLWLFIFDNWRKKEVGAPDGIVRCFMFYSFWLHLVENRHIETIAMTLVSSTVKCLCGFCPTSFQKDLRWITLSIVKPWVKILTFLSCSPHSHQEGDDMCFKNEMLLHIFSTDNLVKYAPMWNYYWRPSKKYIMVPDTLIPLGIDPGKAKYILQIAGQIFFWHQKLL